MKLRLRDALGGIGTDPLVGGLVAVDVGLLELDEVRGCGELFL